MKTLATALLMACCSTAFATEPPAWQRMPEAAQVQGLTTLPVVPMASVYEVVPTKVDTAIAWHLDKASFAAINCEAATFLTGGHFSCEAGKKPVLVRAVFGNGGTGSFTVHYGGKALYVSHGSLGAPVAPRNVPLIVNLPSLPSDLYAWASAAHHRRGLQLTAETKRTLHYSRKRLLSTVISSCTTSCSGHL